MVKRLDFYDVKEGKKFTSQSYTVKVKIVKGNKRKFAVATSPYTGNKAWRVLPKDFKK